MAVSPVWRRRSVYVTSAFRDMEAEREHLRTAVFPELDARLRQRGQQLEPIDLRYGVLIDTAEQEQSQELLALKVCLAEIHRSRPLQIVLIGDRYGWVPPEDRMRAAVAEAGFQTEVAGKSVTALEIEFGLKGDSRRPQQCLFYFRDPLPYGRMPEATAAELRDASHAEKLAELRGWIEREMPDRVRHYRAEWDAERQAVTGLDAWGRMVLEDLWQALDHPTRADAEFPSPTWQDEQRGLLHQLVQTHAQRFLGRAAIVEQLLGLACSPVGRGQPWGACVTGVSGAGKTALFAQLHRCLEQEDVLLLSHAAGISARSIRVDPMLARWTSELARSLELEDPVVDRSPSAEVQQWFRELLSRASARRRVVLLIDGLDELEATRRAQHLTWLPETWPPGARLIVTTAPGTPSETLERVSGVQVLPLPLLDADEARQIAGAVGSRYHRPLDPEVFEILVSKRLPGGTPSAGIPLWLELAVEELCLLDPDDCPSAAGGTAGETLHRLIVDTAQRLPPDVEGLYGWMLQRNEARFGAGCIGTFVNLIAVSRHGVRESDLHVLLPKVARLVAPAGPRVVCDGLKFPLLRRAFRAHLIQRGASGEWDFLHPQLREAIHRRNLRDPQLVQQLHTSLAYQLKSRPSSDPLRQTELMAHLIGSEDRLRAAHYYSGELSEEELTGATQALADYILAGSMEAPNVGLGWAVSLLIEPKLNKAQVAVLCRRYNFNLLEALENNAPADARRKIAEATRKAAEEQLEQDPDDPQWRQSLATSHQRLASFYEEGGNQDEAETCLRKCHEMLLALRDADVSLDPPLVELLEELEQRL